MHLLFLFLSVVCFFVYPPALAVIAVTWVGFAEYQDQRGRNVATKD